MLLKPVHLLALLGFSETHLLEDVLHLCTLGLATLVCAELLLAELQCSLILGDTEQFKASLFVWGKTGNFTDNRPDKVDTCGLFLYVGATSIKIFCAKSR